MTNLTLGLIGLPTTSFGLNLSAEVAAQNTASNAISLAATTNFISLGGSTLTLVDSFSDPAKETSDLWAQHIRLLTDQLDALKISPFPLVQADDATTIATFDADRGSGKFSLADTDWVNGANLTRIPVSPRRQQNAEATPVIEVVAEWDGYVEEIHKDFFVARMRGLKGKGVEGKDEEAEIPVSDVDDADRDLLALGGFFRLTITYESPKIGMKRRYTTVQFRRLPAYSERQIEAAHRQASELQSAIQLGSTSEATRRRPG